MDTDTRCRSRRCLMALILVVVLQTLLSGLLFAGGARIPDQSTRAMGMGDAFIAGADDASAVFYNPAGLTRLSRLEMIGNFYVAHATVNSSGVLGDDDSDGRYYTIPSLYLGAPMGDCAALGIGIYSPFGLGSKWSDSTASKWAMAAGPGASATKLSELRLVAISPVVAAKLGDSVSAGLGITYYDARVISRSQNNYGLGIGETDLDASGGGWGVNAGLQWQCSDEVALGLVYRSAFTIAFDGDVEYDGLPAPIFGVGRRSFDADSDITFPASVGAGVCWKPTTRLRLELAAEWMHWSRWSERTVTVGGTPFGPGNQRLTSRLDWEDSWVVMLGSEYQVSTRWTLRGGLMYNQTPVPKDTADVDLPVGDTYAVALGAGCQVTEAVSLDLAAITACGMTRTLDRSSAPANTDFSAISHYVSVGMTYRF